MHFAQSLPDVESPLDAFSDMSARPAVLVLVPDSDSDYGPRPLSEYEYEYEYECEDEDGMPEPWEERDDSWEVVQDLISSPPEKGCPPWPVSPPAPRSIVVAS